MLRDKVIALAKYFPQSSLLWRIAGHLALSVNTIMWESSCENVPIKCVQFNFGSEYIIVNIISHSYASSVSKFRKIKEGINNKKP